MRFLKSGRSTITNSSVHHTPHQLLLEESGDPELQAIAQQLVDVIRAVLAPYRLSEEDAIHAIRGMRSLVHGFISLEVAGGFGMPVDQDASFHWLIKLFIAGLDRPIVIDEQKRSK